MVTHSGPSKVWDVLKPEADRREESKLEPATGRVVCRFDPRQRQPICRFGPRMLEGLTSIGWIMEGLLITPFKKKIAASALILQGQSHKYLAGVNLEKNSGEL